MQTRFILSLFLCVLFVYGDNFAEFVENLRGKYPSLKDKDVSEFARLLLEQEAMLKNASKLPTAPTHIPVPFNCTIYGPSPQNPTSVHQLRPADIKVVAALGDSITAGFGALSWTLLTVFTEYRGVSWSVGGDDDVSQFITMPNILKKYNPNLIGYSVGTGGESSKNSQLNAAISGSRVEALPGQAQTLVAKMKSDTRINIQEDWKIVTIWIGGNDLCDYCDDTQKHSPENYQALVRQSIRTLRDGLPKLFINLVLGIDITKLYELDDCLCGILHYFECKCATSSDESVRQQVSQALFQYNQKLVSLRDEDEFNNREDFTIVLQPFLLKN